MAFTMSNVTATPHTFPSGTTVEFSFTARSLSGGGNLQVTYSSEDDDVKLDGQRSVTTNHAIGVGDTPVRDRFVVTGDPGNWQIDIEARDQDTTLSDVVVIDIQ